MSRHTGRRADGEAEITRARASADPYRLSYVLADSGTHAALHGKVELVDERLAEALHIAESTNNPALLSMAYLAHGFLHRKQDPIQAIEWFRRAGDMGRARGAIRMGIPALHRLTDEAQLAELVVLDAGTTDRPHVREPFVDQAVAEVVDAIVNWIGQEAVDDAVSRGKRWMTTPCSKRRST